MNSQIEPVPKNYEQWVREARKDERFAYHDDRLQEALRKINLLELANTDLTKDKDELMSNRNFLLNLLQTHKHDLQGNTVFPAGIVNFPPQE